MKLACTAILFSLIVACSSHTVDSGLKVTRQVSSCFEDPKVYASKMAYFKALLAKPNATLDDFLVTWMATPHPEFTGEPYFTKCEPLPFKGLVPDAKFFLPDKCAPDVLYAWGSYEKLAQLTKTLKSGEPWAGNPLPHSEYIWASLSPTTSFTSGLYQIRLRLKRGVPIYVPATEKQLKSAEDFRAIAYGGGQEDKISLGDFIVYHADVISGWSYATPEQYDEIVREIKYIKSGGRALGYLQNEPFARKGWPRFFALAIDQFAPANETALKQNLTAMLKMIVAGEGDMAFNADYCPKREDYFKARKPTYVSP